MALKTFVKISQVNNLSDARYSAGMGVGMLGFNVEPGTVHYVAPEKFRELSEWVAGVAFAAEFTRSTPETITRLLPEYAVDYLQTDVPEYLQELAGLQFPLILRLLLEKNTTATKLETLMEQHAADVAFFLLEANEEAPLSEEQMEEVLRLSQRYPVVLGVGIEADSINTLLDQHSLKGIALKGGEEIRAGFKTFDDLADILENLEVDEAY